MFAKKDDRKMQIMVLNNLIILQASVFFLNPFISQQTPEPEMALKKSS